MDLRSTFLSCIFDALFGDTPLDHIFSHMPICPYAPNMALFGPFLAMPGYLDYLHSLSQMIVCSGFLEMVWAR